MLYTSQNSKEDYKNLNKALTKFNAMYERCSVTENVTHEEVIAVHSYGINMMRYYNELNLRDENFLFGETVSKMRALETLMRKTYCEQK